MAKEAKSSKQETVLLIEQKQVVKKAAQVRECACRMAILAFNKIDKCPRSRCAKHRIRSKSCEQIAIQINKGINYNSTTGTKSTRIS